MFLYIDSLFGERRRPDWRFDRQVIRVALFPGERLGVEPGDHSMDMCPGISPARSGGASRALPVVTARAGAGVGACGLSSGR
jgi:hypothetical protein